MGVKRDALDDLFSKCIRTRADYTCEACHIESAPPDFPGGQMDCAHIFSRRSTRLRHDPRNAMCLCSSCHRYYTDSPEWGLFVVEKIGQELYDELRRLHKTPFKTIRGWKDEARAHYRKELARMVQLRHEGNLEYLDLRGYWDEDG